MNTDLYRALIAFYNQTYHAMTMAAGFRSIGRSFKIDERLAKNMLRNVEVIVRYIGLVNKESEIETAWKESAGWLAALTERAPFPDHSIMVYECNALCYLTWTEFCSNKAAENYAQEHCTVIKHPDLHPGVDAIKAFIAVERSNGKNPMSATFRNLGTLLRQMGKVERR